MQRAVLIFACFVCLPGASGCVIPYAFPKVDFTQALKLKAPPEDVHVFRVDRVQYSGLRVAGESLTEIPVSETGRVRAQLKSSVPVGIFVFGALTYDARWSQSLALRAYRPGFELVEIDAWELVGSVTWTPTRDLAARERAIDSLLPLDSHDNIGNSVSLAPGSSSPRHRAALLFGAEEYDRLALTAESPEDQARLRQKAEKLRERAAE